MGRKPAHAGLNTPVLIDMIGPLELSQSLLIQTDFQKLGPAEAIIEITAFGVDGIGKPDTVRN